MCSTLYSAVLKWQTIQWKLPANLKYLVILMHLYWFQRSTEVYQERQIPLLPLHHLYILHQKKKKIKEQKMLQ